MAKQTFLDTDEDMAWLRAVHCADMPQGMLCAILTGNEDAPSKVEAWKARNPRHDAKPDYVRVFFED